MHLVAAFPAFFLLQHTDIGWWTPTIRGIEKESTGYGNGERKLAAKCATSMDGFQLKFEDADSHHSHHSHLLNTEHWYRHRWNAIVQCTHLLPQLFLFLITLYLLKVILFSL